MADIRMRVNDVLELDYLVQDRNPDLINVDKESTRYDLSGFETRTGIFEPNEPGTYNIDVNGQTYTVGVVKIPIGVIDNFEDSPDGVYEEGETIETYYTGQTSYASRQQSVVAEGQSAFIFQGIDSNGIGISTQSLSYYPSSGSVIEGYLRIANVANGALGFNFRNTNDDSVGLSVRIQSYKNNFSFNNKTKSFTASDGEWYRVVVEWNENSDSVCTLYDSTDSQVLSITNNIPSGETDEMSISCSTASSYDSTYYVDGIKEI